MGYAPADGRWFNAPSRQPSGRMDRYRTRCHWSTEGVEAADGGGVQVGGTVLGLTVREGVVLAADTRTSRGTVVGSESVRKIVQVSPTGAIGSTADLGTSRTFIRRLRARVNRYELRRGTPLSIPALVSLAAEALGSDDAPVTTLLLGGIDDEGSHVVTISRDDGATEAAYAAVGSGREFAYSVLDDADMDSPSMDAGRRVAVRAIRSAIERDVATGGEVQLVEITTEGVDSRVLDPGNERS